LDAGFGKTDMALRAIVFLFIATFFIVAVEAIFYFFKIDTVWYAHSILAVTLALIFVFLPVTGLRTMSLILVGPLGIVVAVETAVFWAISFVITILLCALAIVFAIALLGGPGVGLIYGGYYFFGTVGSSVGTVAFLALLIALGREPYTALVEGVSSTFDSGLDIAGKIAKALYDATWFSMSFFPLKLIELIWAKAKEFGDALGGDIVALWE
jgi:hypothetical protein